MNANLGKLGPWVFHCECGCYQGELLFGGIKALVAALQGSIHLLSSMKPAQSQHLMLLPQPLQLGGWCSGPFLFMEEIGW